MVRIQILELPEGAGDERPPFALIIDQARVEDFYPDADDKSVWQAFQERVAAEDPLQRIADQLGARAVLVFEDTIDIPANEPLPALNTGQDIPPGSTYQMTVDGVPLAWEAPHTEPSETTGIAAAARIVGPVRQTTNGPVPAKDTSTGQVGELYIGGVQLDTKIREVVREETDKVTQSLRKGRVGD